MKHSYEYIVNKATVAELREVAELALKFWLTQPASQIRPSVKRLTKQLVSEITAANVARERGFDDVVCWGVKEMLFIAYNQCKPKYFGIHSDIECTFEGAPCKFEVKSSAPNRYGKVMRQVIPYQAKGYIKKGVDGLIWVDFFSNSEYSHAVVHRVYSLKTITQLPLVENYLGKLCHDLNSLED